MPLIPRAERRSAAARLSYLVIYIILLAGSVTMIYPMLIMLSSSVSSDVDYEQYNVVPKYVWNQDDLWRKYLGLKYGDDFSGFKFRHQVAESGSDFRYYRGVLDITPITEGMTQRVADWNAFRKQLPLDKVGVYFTDKYRMGPAQVAFQQWLDSKHDSVQAYNQRFTPPLSYKTFSEIDIFQEGLSGHNWVTVAARSKATWLEFKATLNPHQLKALSITEIYQKFLDDELGTIERYNREAGTAYSAFRDIEFSPEPPDNARERALWMTFTHKVYPMRHATVRGDHLEDFKASILAEDEIARAPATFNRVIAQSHGRSTEPRDYFGELAWSSTMPADDMLARYWTHFVDSLPVEQVEYYHMYGAFRQFLIGEYGPGIDAVNAAYGTAFSSFADIRPPFKQADLLEFRSKQSHYRRYFLTSNYARVLGYIFSNGYALRNTLVLVFFWVLASLTVQPMAAYALSRFKLSYANQILLFLVAVMSFPQAVTMIPNFLLIKKLGLLNTYAALVLPNLVQGMGIFLLKGYFDSLPKELYEAGMIDGASEFQMFRTITLPMAKPILAVIALGSFTAAYASFMWAFLICQDESMWTLMVFLYQFKQIAPPHMHMAALSLAGLPTLIVFIFAQRVIMRGIAVPVMK
jgi:ABC-type glycerol-3-phosphate transport system permease component